MPSIAIPQETVEEILRVQRAVAVFREMKKYLAYAKCLQETGMDWDNPDCVKLLDPEFPKEPPSITEELLALMPEDEQQQVATSILEAQARLLEQYTTELEKSIGML